MEQIVLYRLYEVAVGLFLAYLGWILFCKKHLRAGNGLLLFSLLWLSLLALTPWDVKHDHLPLNTLGAPAGIDPMMVKQTHKVGSVYMELEGITPSKPIQPASFVSQ